MGTETESVWKDTFLPDTKHNKYDEENNRDATYDGEEDDQYWGENCRAQ